jgi:hypothetical protein
MHRVRSLGVTTLVALMEADRCLDAAARDVAQRDRSRPPSPPRLPDPRIAVWPVEPLLSLESIARD